MLVRGGGITPKFSREQKTLPKVRVCRVETGRANSMPIGSLKSDFESILPLSYIIIPHPWF